MSVIRIVTLAVFICAIAASVDAQGRRVRLRPRPAPVLQDEELQYYEAEPRAGDEDLVLVSPADELPLYGRQAARSDNYIRPAAPKAPRTKESAKAPPVQTIRNYNKVNDDGSFTFGYEAADGSFKEETRGTDCVVRGKYGYVDPDGNKREFTYVSGNPCDPNAPSEDEDEIRKEESNEASDEPANYPVRPVARPIQTTSRPTTTVFQNAYRHQEAEAEEEEIPRVRVVRPPPTPIAITPRPQLPATTFRPQLLQITQRPQVTQRPQILYSSVAPSSIRPTPSPYVTSQRPAGHIDFAAEFAKFQQENQIVSSTPATYKTKAKAGEQVSSTGNPIYSTQLVFDPSNGQYNAQLYQNLPQNGGEFTLNHRSVQPSPAQLQIQQQPQGFSPQPLYRHRLQPQPQRPAPQQLRNPQELYQRQQSELQYQNSQQLFAQQQQLQHSQLQQDRQAARAALAPPPPQRQAQVQPQQQFYYVAPSRDQQTGPIDAFLRGHGIQY